LKKGVIPKDSSLTKYRAVQDFNKGRRLLMWADAGRGVVTWLCRPRNSRFSTCHVGVMLVGNEIVITFWSLVMSLILVEETDNGAVPGTVLYYKNAHQEGINCFERIYTTLDRFFFFS
jgi:hypothetical protein